MLNACEYVGAQSKIETLEEANDKLQTQVRKLQDERKHAELRRNESVRHVTTELQVRGLPKWWLCPLFSLFSCCLEAFWFPFISFLIAFV